MPEVMTLGLLMLKVGVFFPLSQQDSWLVVSFTLRR